MWYAVKPRTNNCIRVSAYKITINFSPNKKYRADVLVLQSIQYKRQAVVRVNEQEEMRYYEIAQMYVLEDSKVFVLNKLYAEFYHHLMAFKVTKKDERLVCLYSSFARSGVLHQKRRGGNSYIVEKDCPDIQWC